MMMTRRVLPLLCFVTFVALSCVAMTLNDPFNDAKYKVKVAPDEEARRAGEKEFDDMLIFKGGKFTSETLQKKGFGASNFDDDTRRMGPAVFTAEVKSADQGTAKWHGTVTAVQIKGELKWTKKDGTEMNYE